MDPLTANSVPSFSGEFHHAIDGKSRITIPSEWRYEDEASFFLRPSADDRCLKALPPWEMERVRAHARTLTGVVRAELLRDLGAGTHTCKLDKAGRLVLPEAFCTKLGLSGEVTLAGATENFEIWNSQAWAAAKPQTRALSAAHLTELGL